METRFRIDRSAVGRGGAMLLLAALVPLAGLPTSGLAQSGYTIDEFTISKKDNDQSRPRLSGKYLVYQDYRNYNGRAYSDATANADIYAFDIDGKNEFKVTTNGTAARPAVSGGRVVFTDSRNVASGLDIRVYDIDKDDLGVVVDKEGAQDFPAIDGPLVVWQDKRNGSDWDIYGRDIDKDDNFTVIKRDGDQVKPAISGKIVVWEDQRRGADSPDIYFKNLDTDEITRVTDNGDARDPAISGDWIVYRTGSGDQQRIRYYRISTKETKPITDRLQIDSAPRIAGNIVVWADKRNEEDDNIWAFDLTSNQEFRVTRADRNQSMPDVSSTVIAWETVNSDGNKDIRAGRVTAPAAAPTATATSTSGSSGSTPKPTATTQPSGSGGSGSGGPPPQSGPCDFTLGFKAVRDQIPAVVGACITNEWHNAENGDGLQQTTGGLLVWRKADNWTAFTNGALTWLNGPCGMQTRPNEGPMFPWEGRVGGSC